MLVCEPRLSAWSVSSPSTRAFQPAIVSGAPLRSTYSRGSGMSSSEVITSAVGIHSGAADSNPSGPGAASKVDISIGYL